MQLRSLVLKTIKEHDMISPGDRVVLGLSGGPDSLCLLHILKDLQEELDFSLCAMHLNHMIRPDAGDDVSWLKEHCAEIDIPLKVFECDVTKLADELGTSVEEAGRAERQRLLLSIPAERFALAHNKDDQAETVMMRILRGTGVHGLSAMEYVRDDGVIRPLLDASRAEIEAYCLEEGLEPLSDSTNSMAVYTRNKVRLELIPSIEKDFNPNIKDGLVRLADNAREDDEFISAAADEFLRGKAELLPDTSLNLPIRELQLLMPAVYKRVIRKAFAMIGLTEDIAAVHLNSLKAATDKNYGGKVIEFPSGFRAEIHSGKLRLFHI